MKKKILIISSWYPNSLSPVSGIFVRDQALALSDEYDVAVLAPVLIDWLDFLKRFSSHNRPKLDDGNNTMRVLRKNVFATPGMRHYYRLWSSYYYQKIAHTFDKLTSHWGLPEILHAHVVLPAGLAALKLGRNHSIPVVLTEHSSPFSSQLRTSTARRLVRETLSCVDALIAVSPALKEQIQDFYPDGKIEVVGNVVDERFFSPESTSHIAPRPFRFLTIALLSSRKGIEDLIEAVRLLSLKVGKDFDVVIGGDGPIRPDLERQVRESGISDCVRFVGLLDRFGVKEWMIKSDVFVLPSHAETFGVVIAEAMACGKAVIATRCGGPESIVTPETGLLVDVGSPAGLASAMEGFLRGDYRFDPESIRESITKRFGRMAFLKNMNVIYDSL